MSGQVTEGQGYRVGQQGAGDSVRGLTGRKDKVKEEDKKVDGGQG